MTFDVSEQEREFLSELLEAKHASLLRELHHTDTHDYKALLRQKIELLEGLKSKLGAALSGGAGGELLTSSQPGSRNLA